MSDERPRVLVVDEDPLALELYRRELEIDYAVTVTLSVEETRRFLQEMAFDVVILEPASNEDEGWNLLKEIFSLVAPPAVILCSVEDERKAGFKSGGSGLSGEASIACNAPYHGTASVGGSIEFI